MIMFQDDKLSE